MRINFLLITILFSFGLTVHAQRTKEMNIQTEIYDCEECFTMIEDALKELEGIKSYKFDYASSSIELKYNSIELTEELILETISEAGFKANDLPPTEDIYKQLPACCKHPDDRTEDRSHELEESHIDIKSKEQIEAEKAKEEQERKKKEQEALKLKWEEEKQLTNDKEKRVVIKTYVLCEDCEMTIEEAFENLQGIIEYTFEKDDIIMLYNPSVLSLFSLKKAISDAGFPADDMPENNDAYQLIPECCKYKK